MEKIICEECGRLRERYLKGREICQRCYRVEIDRYSFRDYKEGLEKIEKKKHREICREYVEGGKSSKEIAEERGMNWEYVRRIIKKNCVRCDVNGERL